MQEQVPENASEDLRQSYLCIHAFEALLTGIIVAFAYVGDERLLLLHKQVKQAAQDSYGIVNASVSSLAEEEQDVGVMRGRLNQLINDSTEQHCLAFARIAFDPEQLTLSVVTPSSKIHVVKDPAVGVSKEAPFILLDTVLVVTRVGRLQVPETGSILGIRDTLVHLLCKS